VGKYPHLKEDTSPKSEEKKKGGRKEGSIK
jgi:hypothetical protein